MTDQSAKLQQLLDRQDITDVLTSYPRAIDRLDVDVFRTIFWEDGGYLTGAGTFISAGDKDFPKKILNDIMRSIYAVSAHCLSNFRFDFESPTIANTEVYFRAFHRTYATRESLEAVIGVSAAQALSMETGIGYDVEVGGRYLDNFEKRGGVWKIKTRRLVADWTSTVIASEWGKDSSLQPIGWVGARDLTDPSYRR